MPPLVHIPPDGSHNSSERFNLSVPQDGQTRCSLKLFIDRSRCVRLLVFPFPLRHALKADRPVGVPAVMLRTNKGQL